MNRRISRRSLLKALAVTAGSLTMCGDLSGAQGTASPHEVTETTEEDKRAFLPLISKITPPPPDSRVVHVQAHDATFWDFGDAYYGNYVDQDVVNAMVDRGVMELTGKGSPAQAWQVLVPGYTPGKAIAVKVNFNNCRWCDSINLDIDALPHPINGVISGLLQTYPDFDPRDVWVYEASIGPKPPVSRRAIPLRFKVNCLYDVRYFDVSVAPPCSEAAEYASEDPSAEVTWNNPPGIPAPPVMQVTDVLVSAQYLINMPIMKKHVNGGSTLSFKNHFGSVANCEPLHDWIHGTAGPNYGGNTYNPMIDIYRNSNIGPKTVLTIGDGLFGNSDDNLGKPAPWITFGNSAPNSLLFSRDPVAIDSVLTDLIDAETSIAVWSRDHLIYAENVGLGAFEQGDPWGSGYDKIDYVRSML